MDGTYRIFLSSVCELQATSQITLTPHAGPLHKGRKAQLCQHPSANSSIYHWNLDNLQLGGVPYAVTVLLFRWRYPSQPPKTRFLLSSSKHQRRAGTPLRLERSHSILAGRARQLPNNTSRHSRKRADLPALQEAQGRFE